MFALVLGAALASEAHAGPVYDVAGDFSTASNPNGVWSYGESALLGGAFTAYASTGSFAGTTIEGWGRPAGLGVDVPLVVQNTGAAFASAFTLGLDPGVLALHPGQFGEYSVARFTTPAAGTYDVVGAFDSRDFSASGATTDVHVLHNGVSIFSGVVSGGFAAGSEVPFSLLGVTLAAGDTLDFAVGTWLNNYLFDSTGLNATITMTSTPVPEPTTCVLLLTGLCAVVRRRSRTART